MREHDLYTQIAQYMQYHHKSVIYRFDLAADLKLSIGQARKHKALHPNRGYPDLLIAEPRGEQHALVIGVRRPGTRIRETDGAVVADEHMREQFDMVEPLRRKGYVAEFACGFDEAKEIIDSYLGRPYANEEIY